MRGYWLSNSGTWKFNRHYQSGKVSKKRNIVLSNAYEVYPKNPNIVLASLYSIYPKKPNIVLAESYVEVI